MTPKTLASAGMSAIVEARTVPSASPNVPVYPWRTQSVISRVAPVGSQVDLDVVGALLHQGEALGGVARFRERCRGQTARS